MKLIFYFHFQPKLFNVWNNIDPFTTQIFGKIIVPNPPFLLISDLNLSKPEYAVWVGDLERLSQTFPQRGGCVVLQAVFEDTFIARQVCHSCSLQCCFRFTEQAVLGESVYAKLQLDFLWF